jgi:acetyl-CoA carboxylase carboxyl transferase subunit alpha
MICPPERCAEILWRDAGKKEQAAVAMKISARDLIELGIVDKVIPEPPGGAHRDPDGAAAALAEEIARFLADTGRGDWSVERRQQKFRRMGVWREAAVGSD